MMPDKGDKREGRSGTATGRDLPRRQRDARVAEMASRCEFKSEYRQPASETALPAFEAVCSLRATSMTAFATPAPRKLPVLPMVVVCYVTLARNLDQLVRIVWLWLLLVLPAIALGERVSLPGAWRMTRNNTMRLVAAYFLCTMPPSVVQWLLLSIAGRGTLVSSVISEIIDPAANAILMSTLLSLTYLFFTAPSDESTPPSA